MSDSASATPPVESSRDSTSSMAALRLEQADAAGATFFFRRALSVRQRVLDPQSPQVAEALIYLAKARRAPAITLKPEQLLKAARGVLSAHPGVASQFAAMAR